MTRCICHLGQMNTLIQSPTVNEARGSLYQAVQLTGFLRCAIQGNISKITVLLSNSTTVSLRDKYGNEILCSDECKLIALRCHAHAYRMKFVMNSYDLNLSCRVKFDFFI